MKNILFICLLTVINAFIVSCLGLLGESEKCNKFTNDYHNPAVNKSGEFADKLRLYNNNISMSSIPSSYGISSDDLDLNSDLEVNDINNLTSRSGYISNATLQSAKKSFNDLVKIGDEFIDDLKKLLDNDSDVCKGNHPPSKGLKNDTIDFMMRPGESDYKTKVEKLKKKVEKTMDLNKAFKNKVESDLRR
jgi:hypothetical protein